MMGTKRKISRADQAEQRKKDLLKVGLRLFSEAGFHATSIRDIAKAAGVTEGTILLTPKDDESDKVDVFLNGIKR